MRRALPNPLFFPSLFHSPPAKLLSFVTSCCATFFETNNYDPGH